MAIFNFHKAKQEGNGNIIVPATTQLSMITDFTDQEIYNMLINHPLIEELRGWKEFKVKVLNIKDPIKRNMAEYYLSLLFSKLHEIVMSMIQEFRVYTNNTLNINSILVQTLQDVRREAEDHGVPDIFLDKFSNYLYTQTKILSSTYKDLDNYEIANSILDRGKFRLDLGLLLVRCISAQIETVISDMNGQLKAELEGSVFDK